MREFTTSEEQSVHIVKKSAERVMSEGVVCEGTTGRAVVGPTHDGEAVMDGAPGTRGKLQLVPRIWAVAETTGAEAAAGKLLEPEAAFYRKHTEALLRRYLRMSTEAGRVPSFLGRELFRGNVTSYRVRSFEDVVIFCYDVEKCLKRLDRQEMELVTRIALQQYTVAEASAKLGLSLRWCKVRYGQTLDKLTREMMRFGLMNPAESCQ